MPRSRPETDDAAQERAEIARAKAELADVIRRTVSGRFVGVDYFSGAGRPQSAARAAGRALRADRAKVSKIMNGRLEDFSLERLLLYLRRLGRPVTISVAPPGVRGSLSVVRSGGRPNAHGATQRAAHVPRTTANSQ